MVVFFVIFKRGPIDKGVCISLIFFLLTILFCFVMLLGNNYYTSEWC